MTEIKSANDALETVRKVRQVRQYVPGEVTDEQLSELLEIARWTGSSRNMQPWRFVVVRDKEMLKQLADLRENITWVADAALAIGLVSPGQNPPHEAYDEGRVTERLMIAASMLGLGAGTAWFGEPEREAKAKALLNVPEGKTLRSMVAIGPFVSSKDPRPTGPKPGRLPLEELVRYDTYE
jgi:nitroreductase